MPGGPCDQLERWHDRQVMDPLGDPECSRGGHELRLVAAHPGAAEVQPDAGAEPRHDHERVAEAAVRADRLAEPVQRQSVSAALVLEVFGWNRSVPLAQREGVEDGGRAGDRQGFGIGFGDPLGGRGEVIAGRDVSLLQGTREVDHDPIPGGRRELTPMEVLGVEAELRAVPARRPGCGRQRREIVGDVQVGGLLGGEPGELRRGVVQRQCVEGRDEPWPAADARPEQAPPEPHRLALRPAGERADPRPGDPPPPDALGEAGLGRRRPGRIPGRDDAHPVARLDQRVGFLDQPRIGRGVRRADQTDLVRRIIHRACRRVSSAGIAGSRGRPSNRRSRRARVPPGR